MVTRRLLNPRRLSLPARKRLEALGMAKAKVWLVWPPGHLEPLQVTGLRTYARLHNLDPGRLRLVAQGKRNHHRGYVVKPWGQPESPVTPKAPESTPVPVTPWFLA